VGDSEVSRYEAFIGDQTLVEAFFVIRLTPIFLNTTGATYEMDATEMAHFIL